jgi:NAD(P)-dependent dehydrogenase (short-subunit alcohol dehydrogenase family)
MKTALITGAYRGLGYEVARQLSGRGWKVIVTARRRDQGSAAAAKLRDASFLELDITDDASVACAAKEVSALAWISTGINSPNAGGRTGRLVAWLDMPLKPRISL